MDLFDRIIGIIGAVSGVVAVYFEVKRHIDERTLKRSQSPNINEKLNKGISSPILYLLRFTPLLIVISLVYLFYLLVNNTSVGSVIIVHRIQILEGIGQTILLSCSSIILGTFLGTFFGIIINRFKKTAPYLCWIINYPMYFMLSLPALVIIYWCYYSPVSNWVGGSLFLTCAIALGINLCPFVAKIVAASLFNISQEQKDALTAFGYGRIQKGLFIAVLVIRASLQPLLVEYYTTIKLSSLTAFIGLIEVFHVSQDIIKETQKPIEGYIILSLCYIVLVMPIAIFVDRLETKWRANK